jgi:gamma-glutamyltranspeptidase
MMTLLKKSTTTFVEIGGSQFQSYQCVFHIFHIHYSMNVAEEIHYHKVCARWVPKVVTEEQKKKKAAQDISLNVLSAVQQ